MVAELMRRYNWRSRPFVKELIDEIITEVQEARLLYDVLPLDRYAQTEVIGNRVEVTINQRIGEMLGVKDVDGCIHVAKWHESDHLLRDVPALLQPPDPSSSPIYSSPIAQAILCRSVGRLSSDEAAREARAENAAKAAAIAGPDLERCIPYRHFRFLAANNGDMDRAGRSLLREIAWLVGVNRNAVATYFEQRGWFRVVSENGRRRWLPNPQLRLEDLRVG